VPVDEVVAVVSLLEEGEVSWAVSLLKVISVSPFSAAEEGWSFLGDGSKILAALTRLKSGLSLLLLFASPVLALLLVLVVEDAAAGAAPEGFPGFSLGEFITPWVEDGSDISN
jgi:hypothetical protein